ncbi:Glutamate--tRNA ligase mitochondrial [Clarireedia jacksonii]
MKSERTPIYQEYGQKLLATGVGYRCFCSRKRLHELARHQSILGVYQSYDRTCADIPKEQSDQWAADGKPHVIRLRVPDEGYPHFKDENFGVIQTKKPLAANLGFQDPILVKSDGMPTYHFANVVDDHLMKITHVVRGSEWMSSTATHVLLYQAFGWTLPKFAHVGLLLNKDRTKLSKRDGAIDIGTFRDRGYFSEALINFAALLGWSHPGKSDVMGIEQLIENASMKYTKGDSVVAFEKLDFLQRKHAARYALMAQENHHPEKYHDLRLLAATPILKLINASQDQKKYEFYNCKNEDEAKILYIYKLLLLDAERYTLPADFLVRNRYFFTAPKPSDLEHNMTSLKLRHVPSGALFEPPEDFADSFDAILTIPEKRWQRTELQPLIELLITQGTMLTTAEYTQNREWTEGGQQQIKKGWTTLIHRYLRWALLAGDSGPQAVDTMLILGHEESVRRLEVAKKFMTKHLLEQEKEAAEGTGQNLSPA